MRSERKPGLSRGKRVVFSLGAAILSVFLVELSFRAVLAYKVGPSVLLYGTPLQRRQVDLQAPEAKTYRSEMTRGEWRKRRTVIGHSRRMGNYSKYFPNQRRVDFDVETGERFEVSINRRGFRGPDHAVDKEPGVIRVITLGASSTFGYFARDEETYPYFLEQELNQRHSGSERFEVINLGIPHLRAASIRDLFLAEGLPFDPDVVTFYEGNNDASDIRGVASPLDSDESPEAAWRRAISSTGHFLATVALLDSILEQRVQVHYSPEFEEHSDAISSAFVGSIAEIHRECADRGIRFIVANQQKNSQSVDRALLKGLTYQRELRDLQARLSDSAEVSQWELIFLAHSVLMEDLESWARENRVPFVDVIEQLDQDRDVLVSWVHLSRKGNRMVAHAFADAILEQDWPPD